MTLKPRWIWGAMAALAFLAVTSWVIFSFPKTQPVYQGKPYREWAYRLWQSQLHSWQVPNFNPLGDQEVQLAQKAILAMGTNALPLAMADVLAEPTVKERIAGWLAKHAPFLKTKPPKIEVRWLEGIRVLETLGPLATRYLPQLVAVATNNIGYGPSALMAVGPEALRPFTNLLSHSKYPLTGNLIGALANSIYGGRIHPEEAKAALPVLVQVFRSQDSHGRWYAAQALGAVHLEPDLCVPVLINGLSDPTPTVRQACIDALGYFGEAASSHAEKLAAAYDNTDSGTRRAICGAFGKFHSAAAIGVPVLIHGLADTNESVRLFAATSLGQLASLPDQSIPALIEAAGRDSNSIVRMLAVQALGAFGNSATNTVHALERFGTDPDPNVRNAVTNALHRISAR